MFRPGIIQPLHGITSKTRLYRILYAGMGPLISLVKVFLPRHVTTTEQVGRAMIALARQGAPDPALGNQAINRMAAAASASAGG
jgi:hypothetical protein